MDEKFLRQENTQNGVLRSCALLLRMILVERSGRIF